MKEYQYEIHYTFRKDAMMSLRNHRRLDIAEQDFYEYIKAGYYWVVLYDIRTERKILKRYNKPQLIEALDVLESL